MGRAGTWSISRYFLSGIWGDVHWLSTALLCLALLAMLFAPGIMRQPEAAFRGR